jgi:hypothetical protein
MVPFEARSESHGKRKTAFLSIFLFSTNDAIELHAFLSLHQGKNTNDRSRPNPSTEHARNRTQQELDYRQATVKTRNTIEDHQNHIPLLD